MFVPTLQINEGQSTGISKPSIIKSTTPFNASLTKKKTVKFADSTDLDNLIEETHKHTIEKKEI